MVPKMSQSATQIEPLVPRDTYPVMRVAVEYFLRAVDILPEVHHDLVTSVVFVTLWYGQVQGRGRSPVSIRELSRKMGLPYETVRRHARALVRGGQCIEQKGGLAVAPAMMRSWQTAAMFAGAMSMPCACCGTSRASRLHGSTSGPIAVCGQVV
jgi:hypothetical protein